jgi:hypothetical protein
VNILLASLSLNSDQNECPVLRRLKQCFHVVKVAIDAVLRAHSKHYNFFLRRDVM